MRVLGIDPDTAQIAMVLVVSGGTHAFPEQVKAKGRVAEDRFRPLLSAFDDLISYEDEEAELFDWAYVEKPMLGFGRAANPQATINQAQIVGAIRWILYKHGIPNSLVDPNVWKKGLLGTGKATKDEIRAWVVAAGLLPADADQNLIDAAAIARWGFGLLS